MHRSLIVSGISAAVAACWCASMLAQTTVPAGGACLTAEQRAVNGAYYSLTRPTSRDDQMPFFDPEYFAGTWEFIWRVVDSPLGAGGESGGEMTIKSAGGCRYTGEMKGEDPDGKPFTRAITLTFDGAKKILTWTEVDSRGYTLAKSGPVGGELGGLFHHHFDDSPAITVGGKKIQIKGVSEMSSPAFFKTDMQMSIDGGASATFGRVTYEKKIVSSSGH